MAKSSSITVSYVETSGLPQESKWRTQLAHALSHYLPGLILEFSISVRFLCLWHFGRQVERAIGSIPWWQRLQFRHQYWRIWRANDRQEAEQRLVAMCLFWQRRAPQMVEVLKKHPCQLLVHYRYPRLWRHRLRTTNLVEGYFHHLRRSLQRYPGWMSDEHIERIVLLHLFAFPSLFSRAEIPVRIYIPHQNFNTAH